MKTIGLIGGMSWESTAHYYTELNQGIKKALGGLHSAQILLYSVDFGPIEKLQSKGDWESLGEIMVDAAQKLEKSGADFLLICTNTMHISVPQIEEILNGMIERYKGQLSRTPEYFPWTFDDDIMKFIFFIYVTDPEKIFMFRHQIINEILKAREKVKSQNTGS